MNNCPNIEGSPTNPRIFTNQSEDGHQPTNVRMVTQRRKCTTDLEFGTYTLLTKLTPGDKCHGWSATILNMVSHQAKDDHPKKRRKCTTDMEFGTYTLLTKLTPGDNCHG